nr:serine/arginine-rich SC35-like splicing factor SCL30A [Tanacetum cinerariifolium]
ELIGFGFVQFLEPVDAAEAKYQMDGQLLQGKQLTVGFAEENRKKQGNEGKVIWASHFGRVFKLQKNVVSVLGVHEDYTT